MERRKYRKLSEVFFGFLVAILVANIALLYLGLITPLEGGFGEFAYSAFPSGMSVLKTNLFWAELLVFLLTFIGVLTNRSIIISIASIIGIIFCVLTFTGILCAFLVIMDRPGASFTQALSGFWALIRFKRGGLTPWFKSLIEYNFPLTRLRVMLFIIYFILLIKVTKTSFMSNSSNIGIIVIASIITVCRIIEQWKINMGYGFRSRQILPIVLLILFGVCLGLAPYYYNKSKPRANLSITQSVATSTSDKNIDALTQLKDLMDKGIITQDEFNTKKKEILER